MGYNPSRSEAIAGVRSRKKPSVPIPFFEYPDDPALDALVRAHAPVLPTYVHAPTLVERQVARFVNGFPGNTMYAVKCNTNPLFLKAMWRAGLRSFDVASIREIELIHSLFPSATLNFMHTVKAPEAIRRAYFEYGVRTFSLDCAEELEKIITATDSATDLNLFVRFAPPKNESAVIDFSSKFGCTPHEAVALLQKARTHSQKLGLAFHVGTQTTDTNIYERTISMAASIIRQSGVQVDDLDVGGGFPVSYPDSEGPTLEAYFSVIKRSLVEHGLHALQIHAEPGRVLVAESSRLIVRVELRKGNTLYINDGTYGGLFDAGPVLGQRFTMRHIPKIPRPHTCLDGFALAGPTCDSLDMIAGPYMFPSSIQTGDWIEIRMLGAYSQVLRTSFNSFDDIEEIIL